MLEFAKTTLAAWAIGACAVAGGGFLAYAVNVWNMPVWGVLIGAFPLASLIAFGVERVHDRMYGA